MTAKTHLKQSLADTQPPFYNCSDRSNVLKRMGCKSLVAISDRTE